MMKTKIFCAAAALLVALDAGAAPRKLSVKALELGFLEISELVQYSRSSVLGKCRLSLESYVVDGKISGVDAVLVDPTGKNYSVHYEPKIQYSEGPEELWNRVSKREAFPGNRLYDYAYVGDDLRLTLHSAKKTVIGVSYSAVAVSRRPRRRNISVMNETLLPKTTVRCGVNEEADLSGYQH
jgi:hypothetical protein